MKHLYTIKPRDGWQTIDQTGPEMTRKRPRMTGERRKSILQAANRLFKTVAAGLILSAALSACTPKATEPAARCTTDQDCYDKYCGHGEGCDGGPEPTKGE